MTDRHRSYKLVLRALREGPRVTLPTTQKLLDDFYRARGPCCAGCDWWRWINSHIGECAKAAPVAASDRVGMLGITGLSLEIGAGHPFTRRDHRCGDFIDTHGWEGGAA